MMKAGGGFCGGACKRKGVGDRRSYNNEGCLHARSIGQCEYIIHRVKEIIEQGNSKSGRGTAEKTDQSYNRCRRRGINKASASR